MITNFDEIDSLVVTIKIGKDDAGYVTMDVQSDKLVSNRMMLALLHSIAESATESMMAEIQSRVLLDKFKMH
jgi:flagellar basal body rod protein FlgB|tara:strand:- start:136 stop:351 length:216 start_codon:yes stop_codon:yes gene_type:complete